MRTFFLIAALLTAGPATGQDVDPPLLELEASRVYVEEAERLGTATLGPAGRDSVRQAVARGLRDAGVSVVRERTAPALSAVVDVYSRSGDRVGVEVTLRLIETAAPVRAPWQRVRAVTWEARGRIGCDIERLTRCASDWAYGLMHKRFIPDYKAANQ